jgi:TatD DNase family protein
MTARLADTHCHLSLEQFAEELDDILTRARAAGVDRVLVPGIDIESSRGAVELALKHADVHAAIGIHPHQAAQWNAETEQSLRELAGSQAVVAIGEIGLDFYRDYTPHDVQHRALQGQLALAAELGLPVVVHNREATQALLELLIEWAAGLDRALQGRVGVLHAFSGDAEDAAEAISAGFYIGVAGPVTFPSADPLRSALAELPTQSLVIETDAPYLSPQARRGRRNEPAYLPFVAQGLADAMGSAVSQVAEFTSANASRLFGWSHGSQDAYIH